MSSNREKKKAWQFGEHYGTHGRELNLIISANVADIERRLLATVHGLDLKEGQDIHRARAAKEFGVPYDEVTRDQRLAGKALNLAALYGGIH